MEDALTREAGEAAVRHAREAAEAEVLRQRARRHLPHALLALPRGAFVTMMHGLQLRGCVGYAEARQPLHAALAHAARGAVRDPRFGPVKPRELAEVRVEVSVLTPPRPLVVADPARLPEAVRIGTHGLALSAGRQRGLLLPQVALDHGFTAEQFLGACCEKAGLDGEAWRRRDGLRWHVFEAEVFEEVEPRGAVAARRGDDRPEVA